MDNIVTMEMKTSIANIQQKLLTITGRQQSNLCHKIMEISVLVIRVHCYHFIITFKHLYRKYYIRTGVGNLGKYFYDIPSNNHRYYFAHILLIVFSDYINPIFYSST